MSKTLFSTVQPQSCCFYCMKVCSLWRKVEGPVYLLMDWQTFGVAGAKERRWWRRDCSCSFFKNANNRNINDWRTECFKTQTTTGCRRIHGFAFHPPRAWSSSPKVIFMNTCLQSQHISTKEGIFIKERGESGIHHSNDGTSFLNISVSHVNVSSPHMQRFLLDTKWNKTQFNKSAKSGS